MGGDESEPGDQTNPQRNKADVHLATGEDDVSVGIGHGHDGEHGLVGRMLPGGGVNLGDGHEGGPPGADTPIAPGLAGDPVHHLLVVQLLTFAEDLPGALGGPCTANIHRDMGVSVFDQEAVERKAFHVATGALVVARLRQDDRQWPLNGVAVGIGGQHDLCRQLRTITHGDVFGGQAGCSVVGRRRAVIEPVRCHRRGRGVRRGVIAASTTGGDSHGQAKCEQAQGESGTVQADHGGLLIMPGASMTPSFNA